MYTAEGNVGKITHKNRNNELLGEYTFEYDSLGRLIRSCEKNEAGKVQQTEHLYDVYNRLTEQRWNIARRTSFEEYRYNDPTGQGTVLCLCEKSYVFSRKKHKKLKI